MSRRHSVCHNHQVRAHSYPVMNEMLEMGSKILSMCILFIIWMVAPSVVAQGLEPRFSADQLVRILTVKPIGASLTTRGTRGPSYGQSDLPPAGEEGSGVVPDLQLDFTSNSAELTRDSKAQLDE